MGMAKLTDDEVRAIRTEHAVGRWTLGRGHGSRSGPVTDPLDWPR
jgi:hypothetical protein